MQLALQTLLATLGTAAFICMALYAYLAYRGHSDLLYSSADTRLLTLPKKFFFGFAAIGFFTCIYQGADALLWWIPSSWGAHDEYGDFTSHRAKLAGAFAFMAGGAMLIFIDRSAHIDFFLDNANIERSQLKRLLESYNSLPALELLLKSHSEHMDVIEKQLLARGEKGHSAMTYAFPEGQQLIIYRELEARIQQRIRQLEPKKRADT